MQNQPDAPLEGDKSRNATPRRRRTDNRRLNIKGLILSAASGASVSALISLETSRNGQLSLRTEIVRASVSAAIAVIAFLQPRRMPPQE